MGAEDAERLFSNQDKITPEELFAVVTSSEGEENEQSETNSTK
jgi:hypothetical protein